MTKRRKKALEASGEILLGLGTVAGIMAALFWKCARSDMKLWLILICGAVMIACGVGCGLIERRIEKCRRADRARRRHMEYMRKLDETSIAEEEEKNNAL